MSNETDLEPPPLPLPRSGGSQRPRPQGALSRHVPVQAGLAGPTPGLCTEPQRCRACRARARGCLSTPEPRSTACSPPCLYLTCHPCQVTPVLSSLRTPPGLQPLQVLPPCQIRSGITSPYYAYQVSRAAAVARPATATGQGRPPACGIDLNIWPRGICWLRPHEAVPMRADTPPLNTHTPPHSIPPPPPIFTPDSACSTASSCARATPRSPSPLAPPVHLAGHTK